MTQTQFISTTQPPSPPIPLNDAARVVPADPVAPLPLNYAGRIATNISDVPDPLLALMYCIPGTACWAILLIANRGYFDLGDIIVWFLFGAWLWFVAFIFAISSFVLFSHKWRHWYVWINLTVSTSVLLFTAIVFVRLFIAAQ